jgi:hypothetical protein
MSEHIATITAFKNKFGNFSGIIRCEKTKEKTIKRFDSYDDARNWVKSTAWEKFGPVKYASIPRKGEYLANCWQ